MINVRKNKWLRRGLLFLIVILVIVLVRFLVYEINKPVTAKVTEKLGPEDTASFNIDLTPVKCSGTYISFDSPKGLPLTSRALISPISVEDFTFHVRDVYSWTMVVDVIKTPSGQLDQSSSYTTRLNNSSVYSQNFETINDERVAVMTDTTFNEGFSKVAYLTHGDLIGIVSLIGNDTSGTEPLTKTFNMVLSSWTWLL